MKKLVTILISCSLGLAATAWAQQEEASPHPGKKKEGEKAPPAMEQHRGREIKTVHEGTPLNGPKPTPKVEAIHKQNVESKIHAEAKSTPKPKASLETETATKVPGVEATPKGKGQADNLKKERNANRNHAVVDKTKTATPTPAPVTTASPAATVAPVNTTTQVNPANLKQHKHNPEAKKPDVQVVQKIKTEHVNFKAQPRPEKVPTVTFNQNHQIEGASNWKGEKYDKFRSYHPEKHDQGWYQSHYSKVEIIGGGAYYWHEGYWYPAWGYNTSEQYYPYDGPIYVGSRAEPPDKVIADVQSVLQEEGYYKGEVDGLLGPLTREALTDYQSDNGLYTTSAIDEPTLASLDLG